MKHRCYKYFVSCHIVCTMLLLLSGTMVFSQSLPREKLYIHTDKNSYLAGDTVWYSLYLVNAQDHKLTTNSNIAYIELLKPDSGQVAHQAVYLFNGNAVGNISLSSSILSGNYLLRAFTSYQRNFGDSLLFSKNINITGISPQNVFLTGTVNIEQQNDSSTISVPISLYDNDGNSMDYKIIDAYIYNNKKKEVHKQQIQLNDKGKALLTYRIKNTAASNLPETVSVHLNKNTVATSSLLYFGDAEDIQFLPEGGTLLAGYENQLGIKSLSKNAKGVDIYGYIEQNDNQQKIIDFATILKGMGMVSFTPEAGKKYSAVINNKRYPLPEVVTNGTRISVVPNKDNLHINVSAAGANLPDKYLLQISCRGKQYLAGEVTLSNNSSSFDIDTKDLPTGINRIQLMREDGLLLNERAVFINHNDGLTMQIHPEKQTYLKRDSVGVEITVTDADGKPAEGIFSIAVTDDSQTVKDFDNDLNIVSYLWFQSDLRAKIEAPNYYFTNKSDTAFKALDALMLTQGFVQYQLPASALVYEPERDFEIKGKVVNNLLGKKPVADQKILVYSLMGNMPYISQITTADDGMFVFKEIPLFDTAMFMIQVTDKNGKRKLPLGVGIDLQRTTFPEMPSWENIVPQMPDSGFIQKTKARLNNKKTYERIVQEKGFLKDVVVTANYIPGSKNLNGAGNADQIISKQDALNFTGKSLLDLLFAKVENFKEEIYNRSNSSLSSEGLVTDRCSQAIYTVGKNTQAFFIVDGIPAPPENIGEIITYGNQAAIIPNLFTAFLKYIRAEDVEAIEVITSPKLRAVYNRKFLTGKAFSDGAMENARDWIYIEITTTSRNGVFNYKVNRGVEYYFPQPFHFGKMFYSPQYTTEENEDNSLPDFRSTIYWNDGIETDSNGKAKLFFFTADKPSTYTMWIEGIDTNGNAGAKSEKINVK